MSKRRGFFSFRATWIIPILLGTTLTLGMVGWFDHGARFWEAAYRSVALFDIGNGYYEEPDVIDDWRFKVGRWTALATLFGAAGIGVGVLLKERAALAVARWVAQDVVVIGSDAIAAQAYEAARQDGQSVLWIGAPSLGANTTRHIALPWPPDDRFRTVVEHIGDAEHILIAESDDAHSLALAKAARQGAPDACITVLMNDSPLAHAAAAAENSSKTRVMSIATISARTLHIDHPPFLVARDRGHERIHALIVGFGQTGQAIARDLIVNCRTTFLGLPRITVIDPAAKAQEGVARVMAPEIDKCAHINFITGKVGSRAVEPEFHQLAGAIDDYGPVTVAYVCLRDDTEALGAAAMLQTLLRSANLDQPVVFVRLREAASVISSTEAERGLHALIPFGDLSEVLNASEFLSDAPDAAARAFCEAYRASLAKEVREDPDNYSARPWEKLEETFRQANRDAVAHIPAKMASAGIDPAIWRGVRGLPKPPGDTRLFRNDEELERLAELEHERWNAQRRMDGWRWTDQPKKDEPRRLHPSLVTYEELTDEVKEFDRVYIRQTQVNCWGAG